MADIQADLHFHSNASDGLLSPSAAVARHIAAGDKIVALADHDTIEGIAEAHETAREAGVPWIPAVEISVRMGPADIHLLGYAFDPSDAALGRLLHSIRNARFDRVEEIIRRLAACGIELTMEEVLAEAGRSSIARPHIAQALFKKGLVAEPEHAFRDYIGRDKPAFVPVGEVTPREAIETVIAAGGVVSMAHPFTENIMEILTVAGECDLWGLEARHAHHDAILRSQYEDLAKYLGCAVTGGTDDHGHTESDPSLGTIFLPEGTIEFLLERARRVLASN